MYRFQFLLLLSLSFTQRVYAQFTDIVPTQGFTSDLHQQQAGNIIFTDRDIPATTLQPSNFLHQYTLTHKSNLFITVFMGNSLTNYLHQLAPTLPVDSLTRLGGYQFSFYVDNQLVYQSNLHPGAPYAAIKNKETLIQKPLINYQREGAWWSQSAWSRFMNNGGNTALTDGIHTFRLAIKPYLYPDNPIVGKLIATGQLTLQVKRSVSVDLARIQLNPLKPYPGLPVSTERIDNPKIKELKGLIEAGKYKHITSLVVLKKGKIVLEEYFDGNTRDSLHDVRSVGKTFASALTGMALQDKYLTTVNQPLADFYDLKTYAHYSQAKEKTTLKELLTMSAAFDGDDNLDDSPGNEENMYPTPNWVSFALDLPVLPTKFNGSWHYFTAGVVLLGDVLNKRVPGNLATYADTRLFKPLGISRYQWQFTPQKTVSLAGGIRMNALDFAKFGQLYQNGGAWQGHQLIPSLWIQESFSHQKAIPNRTAEFYGYLFWNKTYQVGNQRYETYYCSGNGGNKIFVFKDQPLVIVVTATAYNQGYAHPQVDEIMEQYLLPAINN